MCAPRGAFGASGEGCTWGAQGRSRREASTTGEAYKGETGLKRVDAGGRSLGGGERRWRVSPMSLLHIIIQHFRIVCQIDVREFTRRAILADQGGGGTGSTGLPWRLWPWGVQAPIVAEEHGHAPCF
jgi:hypothetical protein